MTAALTYPIPSQLSRNSRNDENAAASRAERDFPSYFPLFAENATVRAAAFVRARGNFETFFRHRFAFTQPFMAFV
jgi:hypothetical protein